MEISNECSNEAKCGPIVSVNELLSWQPTVCRTPLQSISGTCLSFDESVKKFMLKGRTSAPKTLVCHDMKGGYLDDSYIGGCSNSEAYNFTQWNIIDTFVYFSHHFVTIPPPCWIHAAHLHGVAILGTLITEWDAGSEICKVIFENRESVEKLVEKLSLLAVHHNFDGWLINIENPVSNDKIPNIILFLRRLKQEMILKGIISPQVIWYDSVTIHGELKWQNELNDKNRLFFDACDGIFLNYTWDAECLARSTINANNRRLDVYVGIDVFGRNCYGGGGFNTRAALSLVRQYGLSAAIFAPGWVYECHDIENFPSLNAKFWLLLFLHLNVKRLTRLPIETSFCPGYGKAKFKYGEVISKDPWSNMQQQQLQPLLSSVGGLICNSFSEDFSLPCDSLAELKFGNTNLPFGYQNIGTDDAYNGGGCLLLQSQESESVFPLFSCDIQVNGSAAFAIALKGHLIDELSLDLFALKASECGEYRSFHITVPIDTNANSIDDQDLEIHHLLDARLKTTESCTKWIAKVCKLSFEDVNVTGISLVARGSIDCKVGFFSFFQK